MWSRYRYLLAVHVESTAASNVLRRDARQRNGGNISATTLAMRGMASRKNMLCQSKYRTKGDHERDEQKQKEMTPLGSSVAEPCGDRKRVALSVPLPMSSTQDRRVYATGQELRSLVCTCHISCTASMILVSREDIVMSRFERSMCTNSLRGRGECMSHS